MSDPIKKITLKDGTVRYRFVIDIGRDLETGKRKQKTYTFDTKREARAAYDKIRHQTNEGTYIMPTKITVSQYLSAGVFPATDRGGRTSPRPSRCSRRVYWSKGKCRSLRRSRATGCGSCRSTRLWPVPCKWAGHYDTAFKRS